MYVLLPFSNKIVKNASKNVNEKGINNMELAFYSKQILNKYNTLIFSWEEKSEWELL